MTDEGFREVQLTSKKLVFVAMVGAVVLVVIFLLGVMVGRGVHGPGAAEAATSSDNSPATTPTTVPPPTAPAAGDGYSALVGGGDSKKPIEPPAPPDAVDAAPKVPAKDAAQPPANAKDAAAAPATNKPATPAPQTAGQWVVQVNAYSKKATADSVVASLKKKNYAAFVVHDGPLYHVQVGPFIDKAEAGRIRDQLQQEGFKPLIKR